MMYWHANISVHQLDMLLLNYLSHPTVLLEAAKEYANIIPLIGQVPEHLTDDWVWTKYSHTQEITQSTWSTYILLDNSPCLLYIQVVWTITFSECTPVQALGLRLQFNKINFHLEHLSYQFPQIWTTITTPIIIVKLRTKLYLGNILRVQSPQWRKFMYHEEHYVNQPYYWHHAVYHINK